MSIFDAEEGCLSEKNDNVKLIGQDGFEKVVNYTEMVQETILNLKIKIAKMKLEEKKKEEIGKKAKNAQNKNIKSRSKQSTSNQNDFSLHLEGGNQTNPVFNNNEVIFQLLLVLTFVFSQYY